MESITEVMRERSQQMSIQPSQLAAEANGNGEAGDNGAEYITANRDLELYESWLEAVEALLNEQDRMD